MVYTGISLIIPAGNYGRIMAAESDIRLSNNFFFDVSASAISSNNHNEVCVQIINLSDKPLYIPVGSRIAQVIIEKHTETVLEDMSELGKEPKP
mmetsp:Transcript_42690/g.30789  ORF Transcript_42690/g.30789 Transcript_42690/m.30789 type:complete len:94 (-) Transcript_42690:6-287(-)